jgi:linoleate 10R-lipoxygenase
LSPLPNEEAARFAQDDELFERARLVNCGFFMQAILRDYVGAILALVQDNVHWRLNPLEVWHPFQSIVLRLPQ